MINEILGLFRSYSAIPFTILAILAVGWVIIVERFFLIQFLYRVNFSKFNTTLKKMLSAGDLDRARNLCAATSKTGLPLIVCKAIDSYQTDAFKVKMVVSEEVLGFMPRIRRHLSQLPNLATGCVLLGTLASLHGLWEAFEFVDSLDSGFKTHAFAKGVTQSLIPLSLSLISSIILMVPYGVLDAMASRLEGEVEHSLSIVLNILAPEMQPVFSAPMNGHSVSSHGDEGSGIQNPSQGNHSLQSNLNNSSSDNQSANKGLQDDVSTGFDSVPDEEEII